MYIRTISNIYEVLHERDDCYIVDDMWAVRIIRKDQLIKPIVKQPTKDLWDLIDCWVLYVNGKFCFASEDLDAIESNAIKYQNVEIYGMIFIRLDSGEVKTKIVTQLVVDENGYGDYKLIGESNKVPPMVDVKKIKEEAKKTPSVIPPEGFTMKGE